MARRRRHPGSERIAASIRGLVDSKATIDTGTLLAGIIENFGGCDVLAAEMVAEFRAGKVGGLPRQKFLQMVQSLVISATAANLTRVVKPAELTDEELQDLADEYLGRADEHAGTPASPAAGAEGAAEPDPGRGEPPAADAAAAE